MRYTLAHAALICRRSFDVQYCGDARALSTKPNKKVPTSVSSPPQVGTKQSALRTKGHETFSRRQGPVGYVSAALLPDHRPRLEESNWFLTFPSGAALTREKGPAPCAAGWNQDKIRFEGHGQPSKRRPAGGYLGEYRGLDWFCNP